MAPVHQPPQEGVPVGQPQVLAGRLAPQDVVVAAVLVQDVLERPARLSLRPNLEVLAGPAPRHRWSGARLPGLGGRCRLARLGRLGRAPASGRPPGGWRSRRPGRRRHRPPPWAPRSARRSRTCPPGCRGPRSATHPRGRVAARHGGATRAGRRGRRRCRRLGRSGPGWWSADAPTCRGPRPPRPRRGRVPRAAAIASAGGGHSARTGRSRWGSGTGSSGTAHTVGPRAPSGPSLRRLGGPSGRRPPEARRAASSPAGGRAGRGTRPG